MDHRGDTAARRDRVRALRRQMRQRFPRACTGGLGRGGGRRSWAPVASVGGGRVPSGGLPRSGLVEWTAGPGARRTTGALALAAARTQRGDVVAWIDAFRALCPAAAATAGVDLDRLLWIRPHRPRDGLIALDMVLEAVPLVVLDWSGVVVPLAADERPSIPLRTWFRCRRRCHVAGRLVLVLAPLGGGSIVGPAVDVRLGPGGAALSSSDAFRVPVSA